MDASLRNAVGVTLAPLKVMLHAGTKPPHYAVRILGVFSSSLTRILSNALWYTGTHDKHVHNAARLSLPCLVGECLCQRCD